MKAKDVIFNELLTKSNELDNVLRQCEIAQSEAERLARLRDELIESVKSLEEDFNKLY
jgi:uncharacterized protein YdcH (DUF465 family)